MMTESNRCIRRVRSRRRRPQRRQKLIGGTGKAVAERGIFRKDL